MADITTGYTWVSGETVTPGKLNQTVNDATISGITNSDIDANASISLSKLNLGSGITGSQLADGAVTGAAGGGKLAASAITAQTQLTDALATGDEFLVHDASAAALRRVAWSSLQQSGTVLKTDYAQLTGVQTYTAGQTLAVGTTNPTITAGVEILEVSNFATSSSSNYVVIQADALLATSSGTSVIMMLFANNTLLATAMGAGQNQASQKVITFKYIPPSTSGVTYTVRAACESGSLYVNKLYTVTDYDTGKQVSSMLIQEIKA